MQKNLRKYHPFQPLPIKASYDRIEFPILKSREIDALLGETVLEPARAGFYYDRNRKALCESQTFYRGMRWSRLTDQCTPIAQNIESMKFDYYLYRSESKSFSWTRSLLDTVSPVAVKIELEYHDACTDDKTKKQFTIAVPVGPIR